MRLACLLAVAAVAAPLLGQESRPDQQAGSVLMDVIATDGRGRSVRTLKAADFELREDGMLQTLDEIRFVTAASGQAAGLAAIQSDLDERREAARPDSRLVAIFLDEYHVSAANAARAKYALLRFIDDGLSASDLIVVMRPLDSLLAIRLTRNRDEARQAIEALDGRKGDYTPRSAVERNYIAGTPARVEHLRTQVTTSGLNALAAHLSSLGTTGRKTLLVVSEGLPGLEERRGMDGLPTIDSVIRAANRSNVAVYAVDPREGAAPGPAPAEEVNVLVRCAAATGGQMVAAADAQGGLQPIVADAGGYYLLTYRPLHKLDGAFHQVKLLVKRPGIVLRARSGYWAPPPDEARRAGMLSRPPVALEPPRHISPLIRPWFGMARAENGKVRVTFVWEPAAPAPGERVKHAPPSRVLLKVLRPDGSAVFDGTVLPSGPIRPDTSNEAEARAVFDVAPGMLRLRMSIESAAAEVLDSDVRELSVRDLTGPVALGSAAFLRVRTARDYRALAGDPEAAPVASREFSRAERLIIRVPVYAAAGISVSVTARLLGGSGQAMRDLTVQVGSEPGTTGQIDLPLAGLAPGDYFVEVVGAWPAGKVSDRLTFRVTS